MAIERSEISTEDVAESFRKCCDWIKANANDLIGTIENCTEIKVGIELSHTGIPTVTITKNHFAVCGRVLREAAWRNNDTE